MTHGDLRVLLAAAAWWLATIGSLIEGAGFVVTLVVLLGGVIFCTHLVLRHGGRERRIRYWGPTLLVLGCAALAASAVTAAHLHRASQGILADLTDQKAVAQVEGVISSHPNPTSDRVLRSMRVDHVIGRGESSDAFSSVTLLGGEELMDLELRERIDVLVRLEPTDRGSREIAWATIVGDLNVVGDAGPVSRWIAGRADRLSQHLGGESPQVQGLVPGLAIGDDSGLPEEHGDRLAAVNLTHLTAVSGSHVSMICGIALTLVGRRRRNLAVLTAGAVLAALITATGAQPSVLRAGVMGAVVLAAVWLRRPSSALPALGVSIIVLLAGEPALGLAYGFVLSVVSTAAIIMWARPAAAAVAPLLGTAAANLLAVPIVAHIACAPVILLLSETASIWSALANALVAPVVPAGTILALGGLICSTIPAVGPALAWLAARCVSWIDIVAGQLSGWPGSGMDGRAVMAIYLAILILPWAMTRLRGRLVWVAAACLGLIAYRLAPSPVPEWDIVQCDVGQGAATLFRLEGTTYLVDTGPPDARLSDCLRAAGTGVDILILTHLHADHAGLVDVALDSGAREVWSGPGTTDDVRELGVDVPIIEYSAGDSLSGINILWPDRAVDCRDDQCENNQSLVVSVDLGQRLLIAGDLEPEAQRQLARRDVSADIVLVPHHGSPNQDESFAAAVGASTALLSYGENTYGHPAPSTVELYARYGEVLATEQGDIFLRIDR